MPRINSLSTIGSYFLYGVSSTASGLANGWISISTNRYRGITGTFSNTNNGQIITIGSDANSSTTLTNTARIINRHKSNGNIYWSVNYPANTYIFADKICTERYETTSKDIPDSSQNVYIGLTHASSSSATNERLNVIRLTSTGTIGFQRQITDVSGGFAFTDLKADYLGVTFTEFQYILRLNTAGSTVYQKQYTVPSGHDLPTIRACETLENVSWFTADSRQYGNTFYSQVFSLTSVGNISWKNQIGVGIGKYLLSEGICVDTDKNVYLTGRENSVNGNLSGFVIKLTNTGSLSWAKTFSNTNFSDVVYSKKDDAVYSLGRDTRNSTVGVISKLYSNGEIGYVHTLHPGDGSVLNLFPDREGYIYVANKDFVIKLKSDGSNLGSNIANNIIYANVNSSNVIVSNILSSITNTVSGATLTNSSLGITTPATSLSTITFSDTITNL